MSQHRDNRRLAARGERMGGDWPEPCRMTSENDPSDRVVILDLPETARRRAAAFCKTSQTIQSKRHPCSDGGWPDAGETRGAGGHQCALLPEHRSGETLAFRRRSGATAKFTRV